MRIRSETYSRRSFRAKLARVSRQAGCELVERALVLYHCLRDPDTPSWARGVILGALAYFILPMDAIPDVVPITGFTDDWSVLISALLSVARHVKEDHHRRAREDLVRWFGAGRVGGRF